MKKILFSMLVVGLFSFAGSIDVLASCATGGNDSMCMGGQTSLNQSCGTGKTCQQEDCGESFVYSCLTAPASVSSSGGTTNSGSGVLANTDNCSGTCRISCASAGEAASTDPSEYCADSSQQCCTGFISLSSGASASSTSSGTAWNVQSVGGFGLPSGKVSGIIESLVAWLLGIFGFLGIITFVIAGIFYFIAAGDAEMEKKAKNAMKMGIIGIVVGLVGLVIIQAVDLLLNAETSF